MNPDQINVLTNTLKVSFLLSIVAVAVYFASFSAYIGEPLLASAITFDLILTLPIAYWLFIRKTSLSKKTIPILVSVGFVIAMIILPPDNRTFFNYLLYYGAPLIELAFISYAGYLIYRSRKTFRLLGDNNKDFLEKLRETLVNEFPYPFLAKALAFEISGFYYLFFKWRISRGDGQFSYHKRNGGIALLIVFAFIILAETAVFHFLIARLSLIAAWVLTISSLYLLFQIIAHLKAIILRPWEITEEKLLIRCGLMGDAAIELDNIESVSTTSFKEHVRKPTARLLPLGDVIKSNLTISLKNEEILNGIYGRKIVFKTLDIYIDDAKRFTAEIERKLSEV